MNREQRKSNREQRADTLDIIPSKEYNINMWDVEYTDEFGAWWETMSEAEQDAVTGKEWLKNLRNLWQK